MAGSFAGHARLRFAANDNAAIKERARIAQAGLVRGENLVKEGGLYDVAERFCPSWAEKTSFRLFHASQTYIGHFSALQLATTHCDNLMLDPASTHDNFGS